MVAIPPRAMTSSSSYWSSVCPGASSAMRPELSGRTATPATAGSAPEPPPAPRRRRGAVEDGRHLHAQVVPAPGLPASTHEGLAGGLGRARTEYLGDLRLGHERVHTITQLGEHVAGANLRGEHVDAHDQVPAQGATQQVTLGVRTRLLGGQEAVLHLF